MFRNRTGQGPGTSVMNVLAAGVCVAGIAGVFDAALAKELKLAHFMSIKHPMHVALMEPMAKQLADISDETLTIRIYPAGALGKGPREQYNRAVDGVADITFGLLGYTSSQFPRSLVAELPGIAPDSVSATRGMWRAYPGLLAEDFRDVKLLALWAGEQTVLITRNKPVRALDDLQGMKIRVPSKTAAGLFAILGAVPQTMPVTKVYTSLQTGVIDGVLIGASAINSFKLAEVGRYFTINLPPAYTTFYLIMNKPSWEALSADERTMLDQVSGEEASVRASRAYVKAGRAGLRQVRELGREVIALSSTERERFAGAFQPAVDRELDEREGQGIPAREIYAVVNSR